jgi:hypothetical protein
MSTEVTHLLDAPQFIAGIGKARGCAASTSHRPAPLRFVWHHILPQGCGGKSTVDNLVSLCDSCHFAVHALLYQCKLSGGTVTPDSRNNKVRIALAVQGYTLAVAAGTVDKIPNEGVS